MIKEHSTRNEVRKLLMVDQTMRDSDKALILRLWGLRGLTLTKEQKKVFMSLPSPDIIVRRRREFSKDYPASEAILEKRFAHYKQETARYSKQGWVVKLLRRKGI